MPSTHDTRPAHQNEFPIFAFLFAGVLLALFAFLPALFSFFHADDFDLLNKIRLGGPTAVWCHAPSGFLRPVVAVSLWAEWHLWGRQPLGYHLTNIALHFVNAFLVAQVARLMLQTVKGDFNARGLPALAGVLFLLQPFHAEPVDWISGRTDLISTFLCLSSLVAYLCFRRDRGLAWLLISLATFIAALFSKESSLSLPLILIAFEFYLLLNSPGERGSHGANSARNSGLLTAAIFLALLPLYFLVRHALLGVWVGGYDNGAAHLHLTPKGALYAVCWFLFTGFLPLLPRASAYLAVAVAVAIAVFWRVKSNASRPPVLLALLLTAFALSALPALTLAGGTPVPDGSSGRLAYLPSVFSAISTAILLRWLLPRPVAFHVVSGLLALLFGVELLSLGLRWREAGELNRSVLASAQQETAGARDILIVCVPDSLYPALAFRNGLPEAIELFSETGASSHISVASSFFLYLFDDDLKVSRTRDGYEVETIYRKFRPGFPVFMTNEPRMGNPFFKASHAGERGLLITQPPDQRPTGERVLVYHAGRLERLPFP